MRPQVEVDRDAARCERWGCDWYTLARDQRAAARRHVKRTGHAVSVTALLWYGLKEPIR
jgi:hypothetical protein